MASMITGIKVTLESGETWEVRADQRDYYRWEKTSGHSVRDDKHMVEMSRFLAWNASVREGRTELAWREFDKVLVEAEDYDLPKAEGGEDPTHPVL